MATVRITDSLKNEVDYMIRGQFQVRREPLHAQENAAIAPSSQFTEAIFDSVLEMMDTRRADVEKVPGWTNHLARISINSLNGVEVPYRLRNFSLTRAIPWPMNSGKDLTHLKSGRLARWALDLKAATDKTSELDAEEKKFREQIRKLLDSCTTYKQALDIWPQLTSVTPQHILNRHNEKVTRAQREEVKVDLDTDALNMTAVVNTIANATKDSPQ